MVQILPFRALRVVQNLASRVCTPPYDVMNEDEARCRAQKDPLSFVWISRPEVHFPPQSAYDYMQGLVLAKERFYRLVDEGVFVRESNPAFYIIKEREGSTVRTGIIALVNCADYLNCNVRRHENTNPTKEKERLEHISMLKAQTGLAMLFHQPVLELKKLLISVTMSEPILNFTSDLSIEYFVWRIDCSEIISQIQEIFKYIPCLYIADGHHRSAATVKLWEQQNRPDYLQGFLASIYPSDELIILPYHRVLYIEPIGGTEKFIQTLSKNYPQILPPEPQPSSPRRFSVKTTKGWFTFHFNHDLSGRSPSQQTDPALLQDYIIEPFFGINDPRTDPRIGFVGGKEAIKTIEGLITNGHAKCAFTLAPISIEQLIAVADAGELMPPKSTWFTPKVSDGIISYSWEF